MVSYEMMGVIKVACVVGCSCKETIIDSHIGIRYTGEESKAIEVTRVKRQCRLKVTNLPRESSGFAFANEVLGKPGTKVKLISFTLNV
jgi:hypothetical protein